MCKFSVVWNRRDRRRSIANARHRPQWRCWSVSVGNAIANLAVASILLVSGNAIASIDVSSHFFRAIASVSRNSSPEFVERIDTIFNFESKLCGEGLRCAWIYGERAEPCKTQATVLPPRVLSGIVIEERYQWRWGGNEGCGPEFFIGPSPVRISLDERISIDAPTRRLTRRGEEYEAVAMRHERVGVHWITYFYGYQLGPSESRGSWNAAYLQSRPILLEWPTYGYPESSKDFRIVRLPPPIVEGTVTEYVNTADYPTHPGGIYFYATTDEDRRILDAQLPGKFVRTGRSFKHGGYVSVCRFYGSTSPGPNTHFYTASFDECELIKSLELKPRPLDRQQLNYEGKVFYANLPIPPATAGAQATCPAASVPLYRAYNAAFGPQGKRNYDSNHRFSTDRADIDEVVQKGWADEGLVMCVPQ